MSPVHPFKEILPFSCGVAVDCTVSSIAILYPTAVGQQTAKDQRLANNTMLTLQDRDCCMHAPKPFNQKKKGKKVVANKCW